MFHQHFSPLCCVDEFSGIMEDASPPVLFTNLKLKIYNMKRKLIDKVELIVLASVFVSSVYAIAPVV